MGMSTGTVPESGRMITPELTRLVLQEIFPKRNDFYECDYCEEVEELKCFGITTVGQLEELLTRRYIEVMKVDSTPLEPPYREVYVRDHGEDWVRARELAGFWFALPALLRCALELEFGDEYRSYLDAIE